MSRLPPLTKGGRVGSRAQRQGRLVAKQTAAGTERWGAGCGRAEASRLVSKQALFEKTRTDACQTRSLDLCLVQNCVAWCSLYNGRLKSPGLLKDNMHSTRYMPLRSSYLCADGAEPSVGLSKQPGGRAEARGRAGRGRGTKQPPGLGGHGVAKQTLREDTTGSRAPLVLSESAHGCINACSSIEPKMIPHSFDSTGFLGIGVRDGSAL